MASSTIKYSIVIPVYNVECYLPACLDSVLKQNRRDYEVIIVNDGSSDGSSRICCSFKESHPDLSVTIINQQNSGLLAARRSGFAHAKGEYCWSIDSDDIIRPGALDLIDEVISATNVDMVFFDHSLTEDFAPTTSNPPFNESCYFGPADKLLLYKAYCCGRMYPIVTKVVRRECMSPEKSYKEFGRLNVSEDDLQDIGILDSIESAFYIHQPLYFYRQNSGSITGKYRPGMLVEQARVEEEKRKAVEKWIEQYGDETLMGDYASGALSGWYFVCRKCITWNNRNELIDELVGLDCIDDLLEREHSLRKDKRFFYSLAIAGRYEAAWLYCRVLLRLTAAVKTVKNRRE